MSVTAPRRRPWHAPRIVQRASEDPIATISAWMAEAAAAGERLPEAMALATARPDGVPSVRMVLLRGISPAGLRFFTNYDSRKGHELAVNARAAVVLHWKAIERQVRVDGRVERLSAEESDAYFQSRPRGSRIAAVVSPQSREIASLAALEASWHARARELGEGPVPRPENWGGYRLIPEEIELWIGGADRLHERRLFQRTADGWSMGLLAP
jgi:pyridoxamine 5'-phosphate oxidase